METLSWTFLLGLAVGVLIGSLFIPSAIRLALSKIIQIATHRLAALNTEHDKQLLILTARRDLERHIKTEHAQTLEAQTQLKEATMRILTQCAEVKLESIQWQAVARNVAASHPDGVEVFARVVTAHGLDKPAVELVPDPMTVGATHAS